jgi:hypothetical protein
MGSGLGSLAGDAAMMAAMMGGPAAVKAVATKIKTPKPPKPPKIPAPKVPAVAAPPATKPPKPPAAKLGKIATKFPRMFKVLGFLKGIPGLGKTLAIAPILAAAAMGASVTELTPLIGAVLGGVLGWSGGAFLGGMIGAAGGPLALVTGALGGIAGGLLGDYLGTSLSQWIMGQKADGMPWGLGWIDDLLNSGKGSDDPVSKPIASKKAGAPPVPTVPNIVGARPVIGAIGAGGEQGFGEGMEFNALKMPLSRRKDYFGQSTAAPVSIINQSSQSNVTATDGRSLVSPKRQAAYLMMGMGA